jgi:hypothetical protein
MPRSTGDDLSVTRCPVAAEPLLSGARYDYADAFAVQLDHDNDDAAETWLRRTLEASPPAMGRLIWFVHSKVLRFQLGPVSDNVHVLGWRIVVSEPDVVQIEAAGPVLRGVIVARRTGPSTAVATTFVFYRRPITRALWWAVAPLHRYVARYLLTRAAGAAAPVWSERSRDANLTV